MKRIILFLLASLALASPAMAQMCSTNAGNAPYDIVITWTDFWDQGVNGFNWDVRINGVNWAEYGAQRLDGGGCLHQCLPIQFVAKTSNIRIENVVTGGNASGWKCSQITQVVGHDEGPINNAKKERARVVAERFTTAETVFLVSIIPLCTTGVGAQIPCAIALGGSFFTNRMALVQQKIIEDPWDDNYMEPYDGRDWPSDEEAGAVYGDSPEMNNAVWYVKGAIVMADFIYVESNRASSCEMANADCAEMHRDRVRWGLGRLADYMDGGANELWNAAWNVEQQGGDAGLVSWLRETASASNDAAQEYRQ